MLGATINYISCRQNGALHVVPAGGNRLSRGPSVGKEAPVPTAPVEDGRKHGPVDEFPTARNVRGVFHGRPPGHTMPARKRRPLHALHRPLPRKPSSWYHRGRLLSLPQGCMLTSS